MLPWKLIDTAIAEEAMMQCESMDGTGAMYNYFKCLPENAEKLQGIININGAIGGGFDKVWRRIRKKAGINKGLRDTSLIRVLDNKMVAPKKYIAIVEIAGKTVSLGVTDHNINLLTEIDPSALNALPSNSTLSSSSSLPLKFSGLLAKARGEHSSKVENDAK